MSKVSIWAELIFRAKQTLDSISSLQDKEE